MDGSEPSSAALKSLKYVGPIVMGCGLLLIVGACVMTFEARDRQQRVLPGEQQRLPDARELYRKVIDRLDEVGVSVPLVVRSSSLGSRRHSDDIDVRDYMHRRGRASTAGMASSSGSGADARLTMSGAAPGPSAIVIATQTSFDDDESSGDRKSTTPKSSRRSHQQQSVCAAVLVHRSESMPSAVDDSTACGGASSLADSERALHSEDIDCEDYAEPTLDAAAAGSLQ